MIAAVLLAAFMPAAWATSAEVHGPVQLAPGAESTALCVHVHPGSLHEARQGWSVELWASHRQPLAPLWQWEAKTGTDARHPWPANARQCMPIPAHLLQAGEVYTLEISSIRLYRSRFCWQPAIGPRPARPLAVDRSTGRCTTQGWHGSDDGHALRTP